MSEQRYVELPGSKTHELPSLLLHIATDADTDLTSVCWKPRTCWRQPMPIRKFWSSANWICAATHQNSTKGLVSHWSWGDSVLEWVRQVRNHLRIQVR